jgi:hypothetical protein
VVSLKQQHSSCQLLVDWTHGATAAGGDGGQAVSTTLKQQQRFHPYSNGQSEAAVQQLPTSG